MGMNVRRGLPRVRGGHAWPPASAVAEEAVAASAAEPTSAAVSRAEKASAREPARDAARDSAVAPPTPRQSAPTRNTPSGTLRRGLPRIAGGDPWPPHEGAVSIDGPGDARRDGVPEQQETLVADVPVADAASPAGADTRGVEAVAVAGLRRGLPRVSGGDPWPPAGIAPVATERPSPSVARDEEVRSGDASVELPQPAAPPSSAPKPRPQLSSIARATRERAGAPGTPDDVAPRPRFRPYWHQGLAALIGLAAAGLVAFAGVFVVRGALSTELLQDFLAAYPGEYEPALAVDDGFPAWVRWQHFLNFFFIVLIIRSGLQVRHQEKPPAYWASKRGAKISLNLWFHQALDVLWLLNGVIFVVLLFATGHWVRIVPTSWEVFPNALSAILQYVSLDWPVENGWVNYNALQQLAYFVTVFVAAPLAAITGVRMSGIWPKNAKRLSRAYPIDVARAIHFPVMLYFVVFVIFHVALVFATGALRNLNHMYAGQDVVNWAGLFIFLGSIALTLVAWLAARPLILAPIASLFGRVSER